jgi:hypothetical protein
MGADVVTQDLTKTIRTARARLEARTAADRAVEARRDEVCTPPKYPGQPKDWKLVLSEYCRPLEKGKNPGPKTITNAKRRADTVDAREIKTIDAALKVFGRDGLEDFGNVNPETLVHVTALFADLMIRPGNREKWPDPLERYDELMKRFRATHRKISENKDGGRRVSATPVSKEAVLMFVKSHLVNS